MGKYTAPTNLEVVIMQYLRKGTTQGSLAIFAALFALEFVPHAWRVPGVFLVFLSLAFAFAVDVCVLPKGMWAATRKAASCGCDAAMKKVARLPALLQKSCANCGAEMA
jgi:hypothetical protein